jgi:hypothetical protein
VGKFCPVIFVWLSDPSGEEGDSSAGVGSGLLCDI